MLPFGLVRQHSNNVSKPRECCNQGVFTEYRISNDMYGALLFRVNQIQYFYLNCFPQQRTIAVNFSGLDVSGTSAGSGRLGILSASNSKVQIT